MATLDSLTMTRCWFSHRTNHRYNLEQVFVPQNLRTSDPNDPYRNWQKNNRMAAIAKFVKSHQGNETRRMITMFVRSFVCVRAYTHTRTHAHTHTRTHARTRARTHARTHARTRAQTNKQTITRAYVHTEGIWRQ